MCLDIEETSRKRTATKDISVVKVLLIKRSLPEKALSTSLSGKECTVTIKKRTFKGKLFVSEGNQEWICHNINYLNGSKSPNKFGYKYSWFIDSNVTSLIIDGVEYYKDMLRTIYRNMPIEIGEEYTSELRRNISRFGNHKIQKGLHSFDESEFDIVQEAYNKDYGPQYLKFVKCIIPKGAEYYKGVFKDKVSYASDRLKYIKIIE